jgi:hypothetical protein
MVQEWASGRWKSGGPPGGRVTRRWFVRECVSEKVGRPMKVRRP